MTSATPIIPFDDNVTEASNYTLPSVSTHKHDRPMYAPQIYTEWLIGDGISRYVSPFLLFFGTASNLLTFVVLCRRGLRGSVTGFYFRFLAIADILALHVWIWPPWLRRLGYMNYTAATDSACKFWQVLQYVCSDFPAWILVCASVERFIRTMFPQRIRTMCTKTSAVLAMGICLTGLILLHIPLILLAKRYAIEDGLGNVIQQICFFYTRNKTLGFFVENVWAYLDLMLFAGVPFVFIIFCDLCVLGRLLQTRARGIRFKANSLRLTEMANTLMWVTLAFLMLTLPMALYALRSLTWGYNSDLTPHQGAQLYLWFVCAIHLQFMNNAVNLFVYLASSPRFRQELGRLLCVLKPRSHNQYFIAAESSFVSKITNADIDINDEIDDNDFMNYV